MPLQLSAEERLEEYLSAHSSAEPAILKTLYRDANRHLLYPRMMSGHVQGRFLSILSSLCAGRDLLEIGTFTGYATLALAEGLAPEATIHSIEINEEMAPFLSKYVADSKYARQIKLYFGDALELLPGIAVEKVGLVFIDANKRYYKNYFDAIVDRLPIGALVVSDNTLWDGKVLDPNMNDEQTRAIRTYNDYIAEHDRFETVIIPMRDGLTLSLKKR